jgi:hypothetical protein
MLSGCFGREADQLRNRVSSLEDKVIAAQHRVEALEAEIADQTRNINARWWPIVLLGSVALLGAWLVAPKRGSLGAYITGAAACLAGCVFYLPPDMAVRNGVFGAMAVLGIFLAFGALPADHAWRRGILWIGVPGSVLLLGTLCGLAVAPEVYQRIGLIDPTPIERAQTQRVQLAERMEGLEVRMVKSIPEFGQKLEEQAGSARDQLQKAHAPEVKGALEREVREIAALLVALDKYQERCVNSLVLLQSSDRQLERLILSRDALGPESDQLLAQAAESEASAAALLEITLSRSLGMGGAISDAEVDQKLESLLQ